MALASLDRYFREMVDQSFGRFLLVVDGPSTIHRDGDGDLFASCRFAFRRLVRGGRQLIVPLSIPSRLHVAPVTSPAIDEIVLQIYDLREATRDL